MYSNDLQEKKRKKGFKTNEIELHRDHRHDWVCFRVDLSSYSSSFLLDIWFKTLFHIPALNLPEGITVFK